GSSALTSTTARHEALPVSYATDGNYNGSSGTKAHTVNQASTALAVANATGTFGGTVTLSATLTAAGSPVGGKSIAFTLNGNSVGSATTNASGVATLSNASLSGISGGTYPTGVGASFAGDSNYLASSSTGALTVNPAATTPTAASATPVSVSSNQQ